MGLSISDLYKNTPNNPLPPMGVEAGKTVVSEDAATPPPTQAQLRAALRKAVQSTATPDALRLVMVRLVDEAKAGNLSATKILIEVLQGKPEVETPDAQKTKMLTPAEVDEALRAMGYERKV